MKTPDQPTKIPIDQKGIPFSLPPIHLCLNHQSLLCRVPPKSANGHRRLVSFFKQVEILAIFSSYGLGVAKLLMVGFFIFIFIFWWLILFEIFGWSDIPRYISFRVMYIYIYIYI